MINAITNQFVIIIFSNLSAVAFNQTHLYKKVIQNMLESTPEQITKDDIFCCRQNTTTIMLH